MTDLKIECDGVPGDYLTGSHHDTELYLQQTASGRLSTILLMKREKAVLLRDWLNGFLNETSKEESKVSDSKKPKAGDIVHVRVRVVDVLSDAVTVMPFHWSDRQENRKNAYIVSGSDVLKIEDRPLQVGDKVMLREGGRPRVIIAINGPEVWTRFADDGRPTSQVRDLSELKRVE